MTAFRHLLATLSVFAFGGVAQGYVEPAQARISAEEIEKACERALQENTIEAIEDFLHQYPADTYRNDTACYALAMGALEQFSSANTRENNNNDKSSRDSGYGG